MKEEEDGLLVGLESDEFDEEDGMWDIYGQQRFTEVPRSEYRIYCTVQYNALNLKLFLCFPSISRAKDALRGIEEQQPVAIQTPEMPHTQRKL